MSKDDNSVITILHRFTVIPGREDAYINDLWAREVKLRQRHGFKMLNAFIETEGLPKFTWLYSYKGDIDAAEGRLKSDPEQLALAVERNKFCMKNTRIRRVRPELMTQGTAESIKGKTVIMRRYAITGDWKEFLDVWRRIVPFRDKYGFHPLFAVSDVEGDLFTWAFDFAGEYKDFEAAQKPYYEDPERAALHYVADYLADFYVTPARQLLFP